MDKATQKEEKDPKGKPKKESERAPTPTVRNLTRSPSYTTIHICRGSRPDLDRLPDQCESSWVLVS